MAIVKLHTVIQETVLIQGRTSSVYYPSSNKETSNATQQPTTSCLTFYFFHKRTKAVFISEFSNTKKYLFELLKFY